MNDDLLFLTRRPGLLARSRMARRPFLTPARKKIHLAS